MGRMKDYLIDLEETYQERRLARILGISLEELMKTSYTIDPDESKEGMVYSYLLDFDPENSSKEVLSKISRLENGYVVYLEPWELEESDYEFDAIIANKNFLEKYSEEMLNLDLLAALHIPEDENLQAVLLRQIFIGIIGTLEAFLSDVFINLTIDNDEYFRNFIESHPSFKSTKIELSEIFNQSEKLKETAKKVMIDTIYHKLESVYRMYSETFKIEFPNISEMSKYIAMRHDLVHRNGRTKEGEIVTINREVINNLSNEVEVLVYELAGKLNLK